MPNRITPEFWLMDQRFEQIEKEAKGAETFFRRFLSVADDYGRFIAIPRAIKCAVYPLRDYIRDSDITRFLAACQRAGLLSVRDDVRGAYVQIEESAAYHRSDVRQPKYGPKLKMNQVQMDLPLLMQVPDYYQPTKAQKSAGAAKKPKKQPPGVVSFPSQIQGYSDESGVEIENESEVRAAVSRSINAAPAQQRDDSETRAVSADKRKTRSESSEQIPKRSAAVNEFLFDLANVLDANEVRLNAGMWIERFHENPVAMREAMADLRCALPAGKVQHPARWLTNCFERINGERRSA